jgi:integral membrane sensor domain MASE1
MAPVRAACFVAVRAASRTRGGRVIGLNRLSRQAGAVHAALHAFVAPDAWGDIRGTLRAALNRHATAIYLAQVVLLALAYGAVGKLSVGLSSRYDIVALVYAPDGIALAVGLCLGARVWPGVFLGELAWTLANGQPLPTSLAMAVGNTLDLVVGVYVLRTRFGFAVSLERPRDVLALGLTVALVCAPISACVGVGTLWLAGQVAPDEVLSTWLSWWLANVMGQILVTPVLLTWAADHRVTWSRWRQFDAAATIVVLVAVTELAFGRWAALGLYHPALLFAIFPLLIWTAIRFSPREAATAALAVVVMAVEATMSDLGPLAAGTTEARLVYLNIFMVGAALTALGVAAVFAERRTLEEARVAHARLEGVLLATRTMEHELRNQLARTVGWTDLIAMNPTLPEALRPAVAEASRGAHDATRTLERLHRLSRLEEIEWGPQVGSTIDLDRSSAPDGQSPAPG